MKCLLSFENIISETKTTLLMCLGSPITHGRHAGVDDLGFRNWIAVAVGHNAFNKAAERSLFQNQIEPGDSVILRFEEELLIGSQIIDVGYGGELREFDRGADCRSEKAPVALVFPAILKTGKAPAVRPVHIDPDVWKRLPPSIFHVAFNGTAQRQLVTSPPPPRSGRTRFAWVSDNGFLGVAVRRCFKSPTIWR